MPEKNSATHAGGAVDARSAISVEIERRSLLERTAAGFISIAIMQSATTVANGADQDQSDSSNGGGIDDAESGTLALGNSIAPQNGGSPGDWILATGFERTERRAASGTRQPAACVPPARYSVQTSQKDSPVPSMVAEMR